MSSILEEAHVEAVEVAKVAAQAFADKHFDGKDNYPCGFAWVSRYPADKGNTRDGKAERRLLESIGFSKDWTGKTWQIRNPGQWRGQSVDIKFAGAEAYASKMKELTGLAFYAQDRLD